MGFTVEDMLLISRDRYHMKMIAGKTGWSNSVSWMMLLEDLVIVSRFTGKEMAVTTGLGFDSEEKLLQLAEKLTDHSASGLILNTGEYITSVPERLIAYCDQAGLPLLTVPWDFYMTDMIKDLSIRIFLQGSTDEQTSQALIAAIENPDEEDRYRENLLPVFHEAGDFQVLVIHRNDLGRMDTVERKHLAYRMQLCLENLTHNGHFFYYDESFVVIMNEVDQKEAKQIVKGFIVNLQKRLRMEKRFFCGLGSRVRGIRNLHISYHRAKSAAAMAEMSDKPLVLFDQAGIYRLLYTTDDPFLLDEMGKSLLMPLIRYDLEHHTEYVKTLEVYLEAGGKIREAAENLYIHRNTMVYRMNEIRNMLGDDLKETDRRIEYLLACKILHMKRE